MHFLAWFIGNISQCHGDQFRQVCFGLILASLVGPIATVTAEPPVTTVPNAATKTVPGADFVEYSRQSGPWSEPATWEGNRLPQAGDRILIRRGHRVVYDLQSEQVYRGLHLAGTLVFARDRSTRLEVGLIRIDPSETYSEIGFDCHLAQPTDAPAHLEKSANAAALEVGTANDPIPAAHTALLRLHAVPGLDPQSCPAIICCGGRLDLHGAVLPRTWVKLRESAAPGENRLFLADSVPGWRVGDRLLVTATSRQRPYAGTMTDHVTDQPQTEVVTIRRLQPTALADEPAWVQLAAPLLVAHRGGDLSAEVANLSRNVIVESADPAGPRGHTMYHRYSAGSISYAEFRHLGKRGVLGRYPIHYHLAGTTMRGSSVIGASIWDSHNRWVTVHGTQYLVVRDCVGYQSIGHGYFLEDGTEVGNLFDRNLAVQALVGEPLPQQVLPYDRNDGAGFWWANSLNAFTRNVATECDQNGFRFEVEATAEFDPVLTIMLPKPTTVPVQPPANTPETVVATSTSANSSNKTAVAAVSFGAEAASTAPHYRAVDIRTLPFIRFEDNEAHSQRRFGLNLGGIRGKVFEYFGNAQPESVGGTVGGIGPDRHHPFQLRRLKLWDCHWAFHAGAPAVLAEGMEISDSEYALWRSVVDLHHYRDLSLQRIRSAALFFPMTVSGAGITLANGEPSFPSLDPVDDLPPFTVITHVQVLEESNPAGKLQIVGTTMENQTVAQVLVNGQPATATRPNFAEWMIALPMPVNTSKPFTIQAYAIDAAANVEPQPHRLVFHSED